MARKADFPITFILRDPKADKPTPLMGVIRFSNTYVKISTQYSVHPNHWDDSKYCVKNKSSIPNRKAINNRIDELKTFVSQLMDDLKSKRIALSKDLIKSKIKAFLSPTPLSVESEEISLFTFIDGFIKESFSRINPNSGKRIEYRTIQKYNTVLKTLKKFAVEYPRTIDFETIDLTFYSDFTQYLSNNEQHSTNNIGKYIQTLKTFLNEASARGVNSKFDYKNLRFKVLHEESDSIYLNESELASIYNLDLSNNARLNRVRDLFLVGAYTGLRFSDLVSIKPESIKDGRIRMEQTKTMGKVVIPCHPVVTFTLDKYNGCLPQSISNQKMNDYLKEIGKLANLTKTEFKSITKGGKRLTKTFEKWQLISTHTARRSFATNMYWKGIPTITIMKITGHKTEKSFMKYIKLSEEEHAQIMETYWLNEHN